VITECLVTISLEVMSCREEIKEDSTTGADTTLVVTIVVAKLEEEEEVGNRE
jgi:hypothetical protein